ncbi:glucosaminidase domain-containing protein [Flexithrix dorotheae]|uniref:glucosaminidase domain-containing protein n=1 Tax=Flexithrix dorotheae TaxID=70993 RepID=UPI000368988E|nr:glucosaminidase domain-containing protein [Flexithrix dorotheae]
MVLSVYFKALPVWVLFCLFFKISYSHAQDELKLIVEHPKEALLGEEVAFKFQAGNKLNYIQVYANSGSLGKIKLEREPFIFAFKFNYSGVKKLKFNGIDHKGIVLKTIESTIFIAKEASTNNNYGEVLHFPPTPNEDEVNGKNNNAYLAAKLGVTSKEKINFINTISKYAKKIGNQYNIPASALIGIAALESGYGFTRTAYYANNLMGIKKWGLNPENAYQLKGQPDEDEGKVLILRKTATGEFIFDESKRKDNWYENFSSREECLRFFAEIILLNIDDSRWRAHRKPVINYEINRANGMDKKTASRQFIFELGENGYNHLGGKIYLERVGKVMDELNLYQYDD